MKSTKPCAIAILYKSESADYYPTCTAWPQYKTLRSVVEESLKGLHDIPDCLADWYVAVSYECEFSANEVTSEVSKLLNEKLEKMYDK